MVSSSFPAVATAFILEVSACVLAVVAHTFELLGSRTGTRFMNTAQVMRSVGEKQRFAKAKEVPRRLVACRRRPHGRHGRLQQRLGADRATTAGQCGAARRRWNQ